MRELFGGGCFDECLGALEQVAEFGGSTGETFTEECVERDAEDQVTPGRIEIDRPIRATPGGEKLVNGGVGSLQDHRDPAVEAWAGKGSLNGAAPSLMIGTVGHDHRVFADNEADTDHVELVVPTKCVGFHREHLVEQRGATDDREADTWIAETTDRPELGP